MENNFYNQEIRNKQRRESNRRVQIMDNILKAFKEAYYLELNDNYISIGDTPFTTMTELYHVTVYLRKNKEKLVTYKFDENYNLFAIDGLVTGNKLMRLLNELYDLKWQYNL